LSVPSLSPVDADVVAYCGQEIALGGQAMEQDFNRMVAAALRNELGESRRSIKTVINWTGACERTAKNWLSGSYGPSGHHLVQLAKNSDEIFDLFLVLSERRPMITTVSLVRLRSHLAATVERLDRHIV
jgi:hypothetical protein